MFRRDHHVRIATVLQALEAGFLSDCACYFGGGTAIALSHAEFRESVDIDFMISDQAGFRELRLALTGKKGISAITKRDSAVMSARDIRPD